MEKTKSTLGTKVCLAIFVVFVCLAFIASLLPISDPFDLSKISLWDGKKPPAWMPDGSNAFWLGTDPQGRDMLSAILYGARTSLLIATLAVSLGLLIGCTLGLLAGFFGGWTDAFISRIIDIQLTFPAILLAMLFNGIARAALPQQQRDAYAFWIVVAAIGLTDWPQFARAVRSSTMVVRKLDYINAAILLGLPTRTILFRHVLPNIIGPILVVAAIAFALAISAEATLSFLGQGMPKTLPSLGTLVRSGNEFLYSGLWWIILFPALYLVTVLLCLHVISDRLRDIFDPKRA